jgi:hypothetical protein
LPEELADGRRFVEEFRRLETKSSREKKGGKGEVQGVFIAGLALRRGLGFA